MGSRLKLAYAVAVSCWAGAAFGQATPFSADMVMTVTGEAAEQMKRMAGQTKEPMPTTYTWKLYRSGTKMRIDMSSGPQQGSAIADLAGEKGYLLQPRTNTYLEYGSGEKGQERVEMLQYLKAGGDLCQLRTKYPSCKKLGAEVVGGRPCQSYEVSSKSGARETLCMDERLRYPLREVKKSGTTELRNVVEGAQPGSLFEIPGGYTKSGS